MQQTNCLGPAAALNPCSTAIGMIKQVATAVALMALGQTLVQLTIVLALLGVVIELKRK